MRPKINAITTINQYPQQSINPTKSINLKYLFLSSRNTYNIYNIDYK